MEAIKGSLGKDGVERYFKIIHETLDKHDLCNGYGVSFEYSVPKDKTIIKILRFAHGIPVDVCINDKFYCDGQPVVYKDTFEKEFEKLKDKFM